MAGNDARQMRKGVRRLAKGVPVSKYVDFQVSEKR
jgi:hypothetical protein